MSKRSQSQLSRRERQIMDVLYRLGEASVADVVSELPDDPGYDTIRVTLGILTRKGHLHRRLDGRRHIYRPKVSHQRAVRSALQNLMQTFYPESPSQAILAMINLSSEQLTKEDLEEIALLIEKEKES